MKQPSPHATFGRLDHGMSRTRFHEIWKGMKARCGNRNHSGFKKYGGRGISVDAEWLVFAGFMRDMLEPYLAHVKSFGVRNTSIDRINPALGYSKENCRWATRDVQANNTTYNRMFEFKGERLSIAQWSRKAGLKYTTLYRRLTEYKMPLGRALTKTNPRA